MGDKGITISLCMIVKNEEATIGRCLDSVRDLVEEIVIVDTGSTDNTKEIVGRYTEKNHDFCWINDFAAARNYAFDQATMEYLFWLDADDVLYEEDRKKFQVLKTSLNPAVVDSVTMPYHLSFDEHGRVNSSLRRNRLVKRAKGFRWVGAVHEYIVVSGHIVNSDVAVTHCPLEHDADRNIRIYEERLAKGEEFSARDLYYYANELMDHGLFNQALEYYQKFLATKEGWVEDNINACGRMADCYRQLEDDENQLDSIHKSFSYDTPRAEYCCRLGSYYLTKNQYKQAVFWYKLASELEKPEDNWGRFNHACWTWLPHLQLCVCYDRLGQRELAYRHNELAAIHIPDDRRIVYNRNYLRSVLNLL